MTRLVLFDIDGTLILTGGAGQKAFDKVCQTVFGVPRGSRNLSFAGRTDRAIVRGFFSRHDIPASPENFQTFFDRYVFWLDQFLTEGNGDGCILPGVVGWLRDLKGVGHPPSLGLLTGNIRLGAQIKLAHFNLWHHFQTGAFGDDHEDRNQIALVARQRASRVLREPLDGPEMVVIGDTPLDIECARAIGARVLAVATGIYSAGQLAAHQPTWLVDDLEQIQAEEILAQG